MGFYRFVRCSALVFAAAFPLLLHAQFQQPTKEELQMTADPKAPGSSAVFLYLEDVTDQPDSTRTFYERVKVLTEKGKEMATVNLPYQPATDKITRVEGRTIHPDGAIIPLTDKPSDLVNVKTRNYQRNNLVLTLPSVEVGSILEYRIQIKYSDGVDDPTWNIQHAFYIHKAHYSFKSASGFRTPSYIFKIPSDAKVVPGKSGIYTLDIADISPLPDEDWMPPLNTLKWSVSFFRAFYKTKEAFWKDAGDTWASSICEIIKTNGALKKAVDELVSPGDTETRKAQKIYAALMKFENTDFTRQKTKAERKKEKIKEIKTVEDVWKQKTGSSDDIALLYVALGRAAGLKIDPMHVVDRSRALFDSSYLSSRQMDDFIAVAQLDGKEVYLDPGEKGCPFATLHWKHTLTSGFRLVDNKGVVTESPAGSYRASGVQRVGELFLDGSGAVTGVVRLILDGQDALYWRQLNLQYDEEEIKKRFNDSMRNELPEGVQADFDHFLALDDYDSKLIAVVQIRGGLAATTGKRFFLPGLFFESRATHPFVAQEKRTFPVDVHYPQMEVDNVNYHLPEGFAVESAPQKSSVNWPNYAAFSVVSSQDGNTVRTVRSLAYNYTILDPAQYSNLHDFYQKVAAADQQQIVLTRSTTAKGH